MFRRKEDGSDSIDAPNDNQTGAAYTAPTATSSAGSTASGGSTSSTAASSPATAATSPSTPSYTAPAAASQPSAPAAPSFRPVAPQAAMAAAQARTAPQAPAAAAPAAATPATPVMPMMAAPAAAGASRNNAKRVLTVGPDIQMKGEITTCDRVIIEGMVDATMRDVHTLELAELGALKGTAEVEDAEISGAFEGDLTVRGRLTIYSTGRVRGNVTYGEIEIQRGGQISGSTRNVADADAKTTTKKAA